jgi:hypothetical protein
MKHPLLAPFLFAMTLGLAACSEPVVPATAGPEGWLPILEKKSSLALENSPEAREKGYSSENPKIFVLLPAGGLRVASNEAGSLRRDIDSLLLSSPYLTWRWRLDGPPLIGFARLQMAVGFKTGGAERRLIIAWSDNPAMVGRLETKGNAAFFIAQGGGDNNSWHEATLDIAELHRLAWPDLNTLYTQIAYVALFSPEGRDGPAVEIDKLSLMR